MKINEHVCVSIKVYLQKQAADQIGPTGYSLPTPDLEPQSSLGLAQLCAVGSEVLNLSLSSPESESCPSHTDTLYSPGSMWQLWGLGEGSISVFLESGTAGVKARSVNENEPGPTSCLTLGSPVSQGRGQREGEMERSGSGGGRGNCRERRTRGIRRKEQG